MPAMLDRLTDKEQKALSLIKTSNSTHEDLADLLPERLYVRLKITLVNWIVLRLIYIHCRAAGGNGFIRESILFNELREVDVTDQNSYSRALRDFTLELYRLKLIKVVWVDKAKMLAMTPIGYEALETGIGVLIISEHAPSGGSV